MFRPPTGAGIFSNFRNKKLDHRSTSSVHCYQQCFQCCLLGLLKPHLLLPVLTLSQNKWTHTKPPGIICTSTEKNISQSYRQRETLVECSYHGYQVPLTTLLNRLITNKDVASNSSCRCVHVHMLNADVGQRDFNASSLYVNARVIDHDNILLRYSSIHCKMR